MSKDVPTNQFTDLNQAQRYILRSLEKSPLPRGGRFRVGHSLKDLDELEDAGLLKREDQITSITDAGRALLTTKPEVGMGATHYGYSDAYAGTIIAVRKDGREIVFQRDKAELLNGFKSGAPDALQFSPGGFCGHTSGVQRYSYTQDPEGEQILFTLRNNGEYIRKGDPRKGSKSLDVGVRHEHYDFNF